MNSLANFIITWLLIRQLGIHEFGIYTVYYLIALNIVALITALVCLPMVSIAGGQSRELIRRIVTTSGILLGLIGLFLLLASLAAWYFFERDILLLGIFSLSLLLSEFTRRLFFVFSRLWFRLVV